MAQYAIDEFNILLHLGDEVRAGHALASFEVDGCHVAEGLDSSVVQALHGVGKRRELGMVFV